MIRAAAAAAIDDDDDDALMDGAAATAHAWRERRLAGATRFVVVQKAGDTANVASAGNTLVGEHRARTCCRKCRLLVQCVRT